MKTNFYFLAIVVLIFSIAIASTPRLRVYAADACDEQRLRDLGVLILGCAEATDVCEEGTILQGDDNHEKAFNYFVSTVGLTQDQSAGIVGNLIYESNVNPKRKQNEAGERGVQTIETIQPILDDIAGVTRNLGFGIAQWTSDGRQQAWLDFAASFDPDRDALSLDVQLDFLMKEFTANGGSYGYEHLLASGDVRQAAWIFLAFFEKPGSVSNPDPITGVVWANKTAQPTNPQERAYKSLEARTGLARGVLDNYANKSVSGSYSSRCVVDTTDPVNFLEKPSITVDGSPAGAHKASNCTGGFTEGAESLRGFVLAKWKPPVTSVGGYSCRAIVSDKPNPATSVHGLGRAIDIMIDASTHEALGNEIRNFLYNNAEQLGIQRIIWNKKVWSANRDGLRDYEGKNPHTNHLHVEINLEASINPDLAGGF